MNCTGSIVCMTYGGLIGALDMHVGVGFSGGAQVHSNL